MVGVTSALRRERRRVDTGGRRAVLLLELVEVCVWACDKHWEFACVDPWSPRVKNEGGGRVVEEGGW